MEISLTLCLPREEASVPVVRHLTRDVLSKLGVDRGCVSDVELAVSEACTNVLKHAERKEENYEVAISLDTDVAQFHIRDSGGAFDHESLSLSAAHEASEGGRGIHLMQAVVEEVAFESRPDFGTVVSFRKRLEIEDGSVLWRLASDDATPR